MILILHFEIFKINWLLIDTLIIVLLLIFLFSVKIFKFISRWRYSFSNKALIKKIVKKSELDDNGSSILIRKMIIVRNKALNFLELPRICAINLMTKNEIRIKHFLTKGLSSYGFDVVNLKINLQNDYDDELSEDVREEGIKKIIATTKVHLQKMECPSSSYMLILDSTCKLLNFKILFEKENKAILLINPKINRYFRKTFSRILLSENIKRKLLIIFTKKTYLLLNNKNPKKISKLIPDDQKGKFNVKLLENSRKSFKYYETFFLGMIIDFLKS